MAMNAAAVLPGGLNAQRRILGPRCPLQSKRKVRRQPPTSVPASDTAHIVQVVHGAREKLEMLHSAVSNVKRKECLEPTLIRRIGGDKVSKLGDIEGMGLWLRAASIRIEADGTISPEELQRFCFEGEAAFADCQGSAINFTVIYALFLTICISLMVLHTGGNAYNHSFENDFFREALENGDAGWGDYLAWCDLATFFDPEDEDKQRKTRRDCYLAECISLSLAALIHTLGLIDALFLAVTFSCAFPTVADKYAFVLEQGARITSMYGGMELGIALTFVGMGFIGARTSAIMSLCCLCTSAALVVLRLGTNFGGLVSTIFWHQSNICKRVLRKVREAEEQAERVPS